MDFDTAKENIQPLRHGRRVDRLEVALSEQSKDSLELEKRQLEEAINNYVGEDPLSVWYEYICWIEQSYPKSGSESGLDDVVLKCIMQFEDNVKYKQDRRMIKLFIKYIDTQKDPHELYNHLYDGGVGTLVADLYIAWSYYFDTLNNYKQVEAIFCKGFDAGAQPLEELTKAHESFRSSMSRRLLYDDENSKQEFQATMEEKRSVLTSLRAHRKKFVGSVRTGNAVKDKNPGVVNQENIGNNVRTNFEIHETADDGAAALPANTSVIRTIIDSARKNENLHEPGPWTKAKLGGKNGKLFGKTAALSQLDFAIMEDENFPPIPCPEKLFEMGIKLPERFVSHNKPQKHWNIPVVISEPLVPYAIPCYEKFLLYPNSLTEISPEEYRGYKWFKDREMSSVLTQQYDPIWTNTLETGIRIPPGFQISNIKQDEKQKFDRFIDRDDTETLLVPFKAIYPKSGDEFSIEELLAEKFNAGKIKIVAEEDFEEVDNYDNMDITEIGERRHSIYPASRLSYVPRKSIMVRKSVMQPPTVDEEEEEEIVEFKKPLGRSANDDLQPTTGAIRKSIVKRKWEDTEDKKIESNEIGSLMKREYFADTPPRSIFNTENVFKPPAPVDKKLPRISLMDYEDPNDSCSTQQFNLFIQLQSVSTPVNRKTLARTALVDVAQEVAPEVEISSNNQNSSTAPSSTTHMQENCLPKQLSTIMEMTESTQSTKSSVSHASIANDTDFNPKTPKITQAPEQVLTPPEVEKRYFNPMLASFRMPEDQTETCPKMHLAAVRMPVEINNSQAKLMTSMKPIDLFEPQFEIYQDESLPLPPSFDSEHSLKSAISESSKISSHQVTQIEIPETRPEPDLSADFEIPATQDFEIPATQDFEIPATHNFEIPETHDFEIPATHNFEISETHDYEIPATQTPSVDTKSQSFKLLPQELGNLDNFDVPETQIFSLEPALKKVAQPFDFSIYEDSVKEDPHQIKFKLPDDEGTGFLHASRKENFVQKAPKLVFEDFLALTESPPLKTQTSGVVMKNNTLSSSTVNKKDVSDLLKFTSEASLENSLNNLSIEPPKSATPTNFYDDDLNTEKFSLALGNLKNSTLILNSNRMPSNVEARKEEIAKDFNFSIEFNEDELARLVNVAEPKVVQMVQTNEFKMPQPPTMKLVKPPATSTSFKVFKDFEEEEDDDLSMTIYKPRSKEEQQFDDDDEEEEDFDPMCSFFATPVNQYEHTLASNEHEMSLKVQEAIIMSNGNPFSSRLREAMLEHCNFSQYLESHVKTCTLLKKIPMLKAGSQIECTGNHFTVLNFISRGSFGIIFTARNSRNGKIYAMKQEKPANLWEYYICVELQDRLKDPRMIPAFMSIDYAIIANNASILVTQFSPYGSIIDVCNKHKNATDKNVDEYVVMVLTTQLLSIIDHLHGCKIIHADVKPDNFLVMSKIEFGMKVPAIQLIDFGSAIDMDWYDSQATFTYRVSTKNFVCCEMVENKPWTYQTDLFGIAGTSHVMLLGKYMEVKKKMLSWDIKSRLPRYFNKNLWENFFNQLLNIQGCDASYMPNLQMLKDQFEEVIQAKQKYVCDKISAFNKALGQ